MSRLTRSFTALFPLLLLASLPAFLASNAATSLASEKESPDTDGTLATMEIIAQVNGEPVYAEAIESRLQSLHGSAAPDQAAAEMKMDKLMFTVVNDVLLGQEARALEMDQDESIQKKVAGYRQNLMVALLTRDVIGDRAQPSTEEVEAVCRERYRAVTLRVVTAYEKADSAALLKELEDGADMEALAKEKSVDPYALRGGLVDQVERLDLQRGIAEVAFTLQPGAIAGPIRTDLGYSIIRVESFAEVDAERLEKVKGGCRQVLRMQNETRIKSELATQARQNTKVIMESEIIAEVVPEAGPDGRLMPRAPAADAIVARIGEDHVVTVHEFTRALVGRWKGVRNIDAAIATSPIVLNGLIDKKVLLAEAVRQDYAQRPDVQRAVYAYETQLLVPVYLEEALGNAVIVDKEAVEAYYQQHRQQYHRPPKLRLGQITVATREEADSIAEQLRAGADLAWLAKQHSLDKYAAKAGDRGWYIPPPGAEDFNKDLFTAETGTVLEPFGVPGTFVVLKVTAREEQGIYELAEISGNVRALAEQEATLAALDAFIKKLRERADIEINHDLLARLSVTGKQEQSGSSHGTEAMSAEAQGD